MWKNNTKIVRTKLQADTDNNKRRKKTETGTATSVMTTCKKGRRNGTVITSVMTTCKKEWDSNNTSNDNV